ncbi:CPBP family intramembrane glutamic endopeptidase [Actinoallomurus rhizosphaericola]|uniref:CPBP family intramembrane glutamic endopeptidase n=1 Tax=Actinoallomurus rhizosphaericola TaxID=2952536 RepID=UPI0020933BC8|nr:CPBP family intramembrane glutamic endopeptidase [Actinoallomurus rhizosphaericola]MCO6000180.1 CPBP family intramembrane metalloprotease [Actinoallomurus rhizosphaericola]
MRLLKQLLPVMVVSFVGGQLTAAVQHNAPLRLILGLASAVLAVGVYAWMVRWSERRAPVEVALKGAIARVGLGMLIGVAWFSAVIGNIAFNHDYRVDGFGSVAGPIGLFGFMAAAAVTEELMFRGVLFRIIEGRTGTWVAMVVTSVLFGAWHLLNPDASLWGAIAIAVEAGGTLAAAYAATRNLWVPIGLHFGWNYAEAAIFSTEVSGNGQNDGLLHSVTSGPAMITGGKFGPEASGAAIAFGVALTIVFMWLAHRRGNVVPRRRSARAAALAQ